MASPRGEWCASPRAPSPAGRARAPERAAGEEAAVDDEAFGVHIGRVGAEQKGDGARDVGGLPHPPARRPAREEIPSNPHPATPPAAPTARHQAAQTHPHPLPCWPGWEVKGVLLLGFRSDQLKLD